jgi:hypothetical protein
MLVCTLLPGKRFRLGVVTQRALLQIKLNSAGYCCAVSSAGTVALPNHSYLSRPCTLHRGNLYLVLLAAQTEI